MVLVLTKLLRLYVIQAKGLVVKIKVYSNSLAKAGMSDRYTLVYVETVLGFT